jgi:hypothetical protein
MPDTRNERFFTSLMGLHGDVKAIHYIIPDDLPKKIETLQTS